MSVNAKQTTLTLPFPPSANRYWRKTRTGKIYLSDEAVTFIKEVKLRTRKNIARGELVLTLRFYRPRKSGDLDNRIKILCDSMQGICYDNDSQICEIHAYRFEDKNRPRVEVTIEQKVSANSLSVSSVEADKTL